MRWTMRDVERVQGQVIARAHRIIQERPRAPIVPTHAPAGGYTLIYPFDVLPNRGSLHWRQRDQQKREALRWFGVLPVRVPRTQHAWVVLTRVQGPRQRCLDGDVLQMGLRGLRDALKGGGYIWDDGPKYATFLYREDSTRRAQGPLIEILLGYDGRLEGM